MPHSLPQFSHCFFVKQSQTGSLSYFPLSISSFVHPSSPLHPPSPPGSASRIGTPALGSSARARDALWQRLGSCLDDMHRITVAAWHLQRVLAKKRDPLSHVVFLEHILQVRGGEERRGGEDGVEE